MDQIIALIESLHTSNIVILHAKWHSKNSGFSMHGKI